MMHSQFVKYVCSCGKAMPLAHLHFCRHCFRLRCSSCLYHEIDVICCPICLDNQGKEECAYRQNRCTSCFSCPNCGHTLSVRGTVIARLQGDTSSGNTAQQQQQRVFYLMCVNCRWSSRDAGIPDSNSAVSGWMEEPNPHVKRIQQLNEAYNLLAVKEKLMKDRHTFTRKRNALILQDRSNLGFPSYSRRRSTLPQHDDHMVSNTVKLKIPSAEASDVVKALDYQQFVNEPLQIEKVAGIAQRLMSCDRQPELMCELFPKHTTFIANRSMRCCECEHNVRKHDLVSKSMKFKINSNALYHVPFIRLTTDRRVWKTNKPESLTLSIFNPVTKVTTVNFSPIKGEPDQFSTAKLQLPDTGVPIAGRSDATDPEKDSQLNFKDDPELVVFRQNNRIGLALQCTPMVSAEKPAQVAFSLEFDVKNSLPSTSTSVAPNSTLFSKYKSPTKEDDSSKEISTVDNAVIVKVQVQLDLGRVQA